jgi:hypothetical protein
MTWMRHRAQANPGIAGAARSVKNIHRGTGRTTEFTEKIKNALLFWRHNIS